jgi:carboxypeptidase C (cathepsin A)
MDSLDKEAAYDPQAAAISSAYIAAYNDYVRSTLKFGADEIYKASNYDSKWNFAHKPPNAGEPLDGITNVMPDLAAAMKMNPRLKVMLNSGYYDMATPFFGADYEMSHLPIPAALRKNIETHYYEAGHMMYVNPDSLKTLHERVAAFIAATDNH